LRFDEGVEAVLSQQFRLPIDMGEV